MWNVICKLLNPDRKARFSAKEALNAFYQL